MDSKANYIDGSLFEALDEDQKNEILQSLDESQDENNLVDHDFVMKEIREKYGWN